ncbi:hypothetical protein [Murinocardiopsis flavida]|uniref:hypothetical protein n=1 Tax=Murinocardiopsis flavida TaxID=645275 RepID=UPI0011B29DD8|nr:hypothetical protein [Murinocardiopsis flavida]
MPRPVRVWPITRSSPPPRSARSFNGIGTMFKGFTRLDRDRRRFATLWFCVIGLPVLPLDRYYLGAGLHRLPTTMEQARTGISRYEVAGTARLHAGEILRTYLGGWLPPAAVVLGLLALLSRADDLPLWLTIGAVAVVPLASIIGGLMVLDYYGAHWAPLREVHWVQEPRPGQAPADGFGGPDDEYFFR